MSDGKPRPKGRWKAISGQAAVIVGSILLAFGIDAWWDEIQERAAAEELAVGLLVDLEVTLDDLRERHDRHRRRMSAVLQLREELRHPVPTVPMDSINTLLSQTLLVARQTPVFRSHDQLVATGRLRLLDREIRDGVSRWVARLETSQGYLERDLLDFRQNNALPLWIGSRLSLDQVMADYVGPDLGEPRFPHDWPSLRESRELSDILIWNAALSRVIIDQQELQEAALVELIALLRASYGPT